MNVIVSKTLSDNFEHFVVVKSIKRVLELEGVKTLILHTFEDTSFDAGIYISRCYNSGIENYLYINENPDPAIRTVLRGVFGRIYEDEFYFDDEEELLCLLEELKSADTDSYSLVNSDIVKDFIRGFSRGEERIKAPVYLNRVEQALNELSVTTETQKAQIETMGRTVLDVYNRANEIITRMAKQRDKLEVELRNLEATSTNSGGSRGFGSTVIHYPTVNYTGTMNILLIREYSPCMYLTSFLIAYQHYLRYELNKRVKLIFVVQKGKGILGRYSDFTTITQESASMDSLYETDMIVLNNPKAEVLKKLFTRVADIEIIVDRLYGSSNIVSGSVTTLNAVGGMSHIKRNKLEKSKTICSVQEIEGALFSIPTIANYPQGSDKRFSAYIQIMGDEFKKMDEVLKIVK